MQWQLDSCTERENLSLGCQGRRPSGAHRKDQSTVYPPLPDPCPARRVPPHPALRPPPLRDRKFADSSLEGRVRSEPVSEVGAFGAGELRRDSKTFMDDFGSVRAP